MSICYLNGSYVPLREACLPVTDLAIQRGIGVFDSLRTYGRRPFALTPHLERFFASAEQVHMAPPLGMDELRRIIASARAGSLRVSSCALASVL